MEHLGFDISTDGDVSLVRVRGEIDVTTAPDLREVLLLAHDCTARDVTVDLRRVSFIDSKAIAILVHVHRDLAAVGHRLRIQNARGSVEKVLRLTGVTDYLAGDATPAV